jgi:hypothetical protein
MEMGGEEALISVIPRMRRATPSIILIGAVFGRCADMTERPARRRKCPENGL